MSETKRIENSDGSLALKYRLKLDALAEAVLDREKEVMFFLGAGASMSRDRNGLPSGQELAEQLAAKCHLDWKQYVALSTVAFYYESTFGRASLNKILRERIASPQAEPSQTIKHLVRLIKLLEAQEMKTLVVTTNYDQKFEEEYERQAGKLPTVVIFRGATDPNDLSASLHDGLGRYRNRPQDWTHDPEKGLTSVYKMHGCISQAIGDSRSLVITEEDYINFLTNALSHDEKKQILRYVKGRIAMSTVLFIGYGLADWNFRVIYKATAETNRDHEAYAVQYFFPDSKGQQLDIENLKWENLITFWEKKSVNIINVDAATFVEDLLAAVSQRLAQQSAITVRG